MIIFALYSLAGGGDKGASGGNISNVELIKELAKSRRVTVIAPSVSDSLSRDLQECGVTVITSSFSRRGILARLAKRRWIRSTISEAIHSLADTSIVVASNGTCDLAYESLSKHRPTPADRPRLFVLCRAFEDMFYTRLSASYTSMAKGFLFDAISLGRTRRAYRAADRVIVNSSFMRLTVIDYFGLNSSQIHILYPPVENADWAWRAPSNKPVVGIINPSRHKGEGIFLALADRFSDVEFTYFGAIDKQYCQPNITYGGWMSDSNALYSKIDVLIVPSRWHEPFGRVAVEAINHGIPALVSSKGGLPETIDPEFVVLGETTDDWAAPLEHILMPGNSCKEAWQRSKSITAKFSPTHHHSAIRGIFS